MTAAILAGGLTGLVLGFLGAGGTVVGLPVLLFLGRMHPHTAMGTNAAGVALVAFALLGWRAWRGVVPWREALLFAAPGVAGDLVGGRLGLIVPGRGLVFLLGILLFAVAAWLVYLSAREASNGGPPRTRGRKHVWLVVVIAFIVGLIAGFFAVGGGFMIVPALALVGGLDLLDAAAAGLLPIAAFAGAVASQYLVAGDVRLALAAAMVIPGITGGAVGVALARRLPRALLQRVFAAVLVVIGVYMSLG